MRWPIPLTANDSLSDCLFSLNCRTGLEEDLQLGIEHVSAQPELVTQVRHRDIVQKVPARKAGMKTLDGEIISDAVTRLTMNVVDPKPK